MKTTQDEVSYNLKQTLVRRRRTSSQLQLTERIPSWNENEKSTSIKFGEQKTKLKYRILPVLFQFTTLLTNINRSRTVGLDDFKLMILTEAD